MRPHSLAPVTDVTSTVRDLVPATASSIGAPGIGAAVTGAGSVAGALLSRLDAEHPVLAELPVRERLLAAAWLGSYRSARTRRAYAGDLAAWLGWLREIDVDVLHARRVHIDLWVRQLLDTGAAGSSTSRRLSALSSFYRHLVEHDLITANPATAVRRPTVDPDHTATAGLDEWERVIAATYARRQGKLPGKNWLLNAMTLVRRCYRMLSAAYDRRPWWRREEWNLALDPRIPRRPHEPSGASSLYFHNLDPPWLRVGGAVAVQGRVGHR